MLEAFGVSDQGCVRKNNEDYYHIDQAHGLYLVADGMGGAQAGETASRLAVETVAGHLGNAQHPAIEQLLEAFQSANQCVLEAAATDSELEGMGTTLVAVMECGSQLAVASVGDSRVYAFHEGKLKAVTEDQTWAQEVGRRLGLDEQTLKTHPLRHVLTMAIGVSKALRIHSYSVERVPGTLYLLCSDGLYGVLPPETITEILNSEQSLATKGHYLIEAARKAGGPDNITAVLLRVAG